MTLEEAIKHAEEVAENKEKAIKLAKGNPDHPMLSMSEKGITEYKKCINEHRQLAEWLKELKAYREQGDDTVSRQAVEDAIAEEVVNGESLGYAVAYDILSDLPSATPQSNIGYWIDDHCSVCGKGIEDLIDSHEWYRNEEPNFCPFCGVKLIDLQESEE